MIIEVKDEALKHANLSEAEFRKEIALLMYEKRIWNTKTARGFCGMERLDFLKFAGSRNVGVDYDVDDLLQDWETIKKSRDADS